MFTLIYTIAIIPYCKKKKKEKRTKGCCVRLSTYESNLDTFILCNSIQQKDWIGPQDFALFQSNTQNKILFIVKQKWTYCAVYVSIYLHVKNISKK